MSLRAVSARRAPWLAVIAAGLLLVLAGCASRVAPVSARPPAIGRLAGVATQMDARAVRGLLGEPDAVRDYQTWQSWNPLYWKSGTARTDWSYAGAGRVVFSRNRYSGRLAVIEVVPEDSGAD